MPLIAAMTVMILSLPSMANKKLEIIFFIFTFLNHFVIRVENLKRNDYNISVKFIL